MAWIDPITVTALDGVAASHYNAHSNDITYLATARPHDQTTVATTGSDLSLGNTAWTATGLATVTLTTYAPGAKVHLCATFTGSTSSGHNAFFDWFEGTTQAPKDEAGSAGDTYGRACIMNSVRMNVHCEAFFYAVTAGSHTYTLKYKTDVGTAATLTILVNNVPVSIWGKEEG